MTHYTKNSVHILNVKMDGKLLGLFKKFGVLLECFLRVRWDWGLRLESI